MRPSLLFFLLFLLQFFYFPMGMSYFEGSKVYAAEFCIFLLFVSQIFSKEGFVLKNYKESFLWCSGILIALTTYHLIFQQTSTLFFGNAFRQQGTVLLWLLILFAILSSRIVIEKYIKKPFIVVVLFVQLICTLLFIGVGSDRPIGTLGEPNALAASVIFIWPFLIFSMPKKMLGKMLVFFGLLFAFIIVFVSGSRSGIIALVVQLVFLISCKFFPKRQIIALVLAFTVLIGSLLLPFLTHRNEYEDRGEIWTAAFVAASAHPIFGVGFGNAEYELHKANVKLHNHLPGYYVDSAHNIFLDWFVQAGIIGLGVFVFLLYKAFKSFMITKHTQNSVLLLGLIAALSFNPASVVSLVALWWLIGQGNKLTDPT